LDRINGTGTLDRPGGAFIFTFNTTTRQFVQEAVFEGERNADSFGKQQLPSSTHTFSILISKLIGVDSSEQTHPN
jgi:hypothetical protein